MKILHSKKETNELEIISTKSTNALEVLLRTIFAVCLTAAIVLSVGVISQLVQKSPLTASVPNASLTIQNSGKFVESLSDSNDAVLKTDTKEIGYEAVIVDVVLNKPSISAVLIIELPEILFAVFLGLICLFLLRVVQRYRLGILFASDSILGIKWIFRLVGIMVIGYTIFPQIQTMVILNQEGFVQPKEVIYNFPFGFFIVAIIITLFGELVVNLFKDAIVMKEVNDATI